MTVGRGISIGNFYLFHHRSSLLSPMTPGSEVNRKVGEGGRIILNMGFLCSMHRGEEGMRDYGGGEKGGEGKERGEQL
jgi:hypothetical protein